MEKWSDSRKEKRRDKTPCLRIAGGLLLFCFFLIATFPARSRNLDSLIFEQYKGKLLKEQHDSPGKLLVKTAEYFLDRPYQASTLENGSARESLTVDLRSFDCVTYVESCLALSFTLQTECPSYVLFKKLLRTLRYRSGVIDGYASRLHYMSDWISDNEAKGFFHDITSSLGGIPLRKELTFMTDNAHLYPSLHNNLQQMEEIRQIEQAISKRDKSRFLPKKQIRAKLSALRDGDIVVFASRRKGLDFSHVGIVKCMKQGEVTFLHASSKQKKTTLQESSLVDYCLSSKEIIGVAIVRVKQDFPLSLKN